MSMLCRHAALFAMLATALPACDTDTAPPLPAPTPEVADTPTVVVRHEEQAAVGFPTLELVGYVLNCMSDHGGQTVENLYSCSCRVDYLSAHMSFEAYQNASTYRRYRGMPGKRGGMFRENDDAEQLVSELEEHEVMAERSCPIVRRSPGSKDTEPS